MHETYLFFRMSIYAVGSTQLPIGWLMRSLSSEVKQPGCDVGHSLPPSAEIKMGEDVSLISLYVFMACTGTTLHLQGEDKSLHTLVSELKA